MTGTQAPRPDHPRETSLDSNTGGGRRRRLRCAVVGLGRIGSTLEDDPLREKPASHAGAIRANRHCLLVAGCDRRLDRREAFARRWGCREVFDEVRPMLEAHHPDILHLATPAETHGRLIIEAAAGGVPVIICEKPLCPTAAEARNALALCRDAGVALMVNHERRYSRDYREIRHTVLEGRYGPLLSIRGSLCMGRGQAPGRILLEDGTHMVDVVRFLTGGEIEPTCARGDAAASGGTLQVLFRCGGAAGYLEVSGGHEALVFELELGFVRGRLRIGNGIYEEWKSEPSPYYQDFRSLRALRRRPWRTTGYFADMLVDAVAVAREPGRAPVSSGLDALRALEVIESIVSLARP